MKITKMICCTLIAGLLFAETAQEIIAKVDKNAVFASSKYSAKMRISIGGTTREKEFTGYSEGKEMAYMEFTAPARDRGTRFLKVKDEMWMYLPTVERATKIAGHMLRQSMMGSDFSYDDIAENDRLVDLYDMELLGIETVDSRECYVIALTAKVAEVNYSQRKIWVDKERYVTVKAEMYARTGKLMKEISAGEFKRIGQYTFATRVRMVNKLRQDTFTELILSDVELDVAVPDRVFTKAYLERK